MSIEQHPIQPVKIWLQEWTPALRVKFVPELEAALSTAERPVKIEIETFRWDWHTFHSRLLQSLRDQTAPDIVEIGTTWTGLLAQENVLLDITGFATHDLQAANRFFPRHLASCRTFTAHNRYYGIPMLADTRILFYNNEIFNAYLQEHPAAFGSWSAFAAMCQAIKAIAPNGVVAWPWGHEDAFHDCLPWIWAAGGEIISTAGELLIDSADTQRAFQYLANLILTDCAVLPPDPLVRSNHDIRTYFAAGQVGIMTGAFWMMHQLGQFREIKTALHPPDLLPATFSGGSNLALVKKYGSNEQQQTYTVAKAVVSHLTNTDSQVTLAPAIGKLPCNIAAWKALKRQTHNHQMRAIFETFDDALCYTVERNLPNLPNLVQIEEVLKTGISALWVKIGELKRKSPTQTLDELKHACDDLIHQELTQLRRQVETYMTGPILQFTPQNVADMGLVAPDRFDLWVEVTSADPPDGYVYVKNRGRIEAGMGRQNFAILFALLCAPQQTLSEAELLQRFWQFAPQIDKADLNAISGAAEKIAHLAELLRKSLDATPTQLDLLWKQVAEVDRTSQDAQEKERTVKALQMQIYHALQTFSAALTFHQQDYRQAVDRLRKAKDGINKALGPINGEDVIKQLTKAKYDLALNPHLAICLVIA